MRIHLIAIGGSAMHNLAIALHCNHHTVSGSDDEIYDPARSRLASYGLLPDQMGWNPERISADLDAIILGMHARRDNPELERALALNIPVYSYPEYLYQQALDKRRVVIAGSHGKTTTTSMIMHALQSHQWDYDYLVGAQLEGFERMVRISDAPTMIIEGDEYLSSALDLRPKFLHYQAHIAIITGIAWDHINVFPTFEAYTRQFALFLESLAPNAQVFYFSGDPILSELCQNSTRSDLRFTPYKAFSATTQNGQTSLKHESKEIPLRIFGQHNLENLRAAALACSALGMSESDFLQAAASFAGAAKRLQLLAQTDSALVFQDFAHAPSKVMATLKAVKAQYPERRLTACLELHTFSSLNKAFLPHYRGAMEAADRAIVYFTDHTLEMKKLPPISKEEVRQAFELDKLEVIKDNVELANQLQAEDWTNHNLLLMSSGNFGGWNLPDLANKLLTAKV